MRASRELRWRVGLLISVASWAVAGVGCGSGGSGSSASALALVQKFQDTYNRGDDMAAAQLWSPSVGVPASYTPGYPVPSPTFKLRTTQAVAKKLALGCLRRQNSISAGGTSEVRVVHLTYTSYGQRPGHRRCTAEGQTWREEITVIGGKIREVVSTRLS